MRWDDFRRSGNVEDRRGLSPGTVVRGGGLGLGTIVILGLIAWGLGIDPRQLIGEAERISSGPTSYQTPNSGSSGAERQGQGTGAGTASDQTGQFVAAVLGETEDRWSEIFRAMGRTYQAPKLVMFSGLTQSACGTAQAAMGPFYCPNDQRVYLEHAFKAAKSAVRRASFHMPM